MSDSQKGSFFYNLEKSAIISIVGVILLFSGSVIVTLISPNLIDPTWTEPTSPYQVQMYEVSDPNYYISSSSSNGGVLESVHHLEEGKTLLAFIESDTVRILAPPELEQYVNRIGETPLKLTSKLLLVKKTENNAEADKLRKQFQETWEKANPHWKEEGIEKPAFEIVELYDPQLKETFSLASSEGIIEEWVDKNFTLIEEPKERWHNDSGVIYIPNPIEFRISPYIFGNERGWKYDPQGKSIKDVNELKSHSLGFRSRQELIAMGEHIYAIEGCWYCHTDQTRTLVQDVVLNGSDSYPAPPSSANEYIYQKITFPGTRRIGPDVSRVGVKRPSRDWHKAHFWSPKTASQGSIMPSFRHFFDDDPRGTSKALPGVPNYQFEAMFQYLMTKGTRITPPTEAWWLGLDPIKTKEIIEGQRKLP
jgi:cytochrome c oxidase cbb3-type subunit 2